MDWQKEKRDSLQSLNQLSSLPRTNISSPSTGVALPGQVSALPAGSQVPTGPSMELMTLANKPTLDKKATIYAEVVRNLNDARERGLTFKPAAAFRSAYESLGLEASGAKSVGMRKIWHLVQIRLRDYGVLDFDAGDSRRQPPIDTTWQQIYFCLRTGYYDEARTVVQSSRVSHQFAPQLMEWITTGGMVSPETAAAASDECEKMLRMGDRAGRSGYDKKKLLLYAIISGCRRQIDRLLRDLPTLFNTIEDFLWFKLSAVRDSPSGSSSVILNEGLVPYTLDDLQVSYYTKNGKDPLVYPYVLLLSIQLLPSVLYLSKETGEEGYNIDAVHIAIVLADHGVLSEGTGTGQKLGVMDAFSEVSSLIRQYGSLYLRLGNLSLALEYFAQAAAAMGGGQMSWSGRGSIDQQRQRNLMLKQLLTEILLGAGEEGDLRRFFADRNTQQQFLLEAARQCQEVGFYDKKTNLEIQKRVGAFATALETINKCLSEAICALSRGSLDGESRTAGLIHSGNVILETYKYSPEASLQGRGHIFEQEVILRQLEAILFVHKMARAGHHADALREITKLSFLPLDPRAPDIIRDVFQSLSPYVQECVPDLLKVAVYSMDSMTDADGTLRALRTKVDLAERCRQPNLNPDIDGVSKLSPPQMQDSHAAAGIMKRKRKRKRKRKYWFG
ncbi:hypothetical protein ACLOJK_000357 [Asimina triloba]